MEMDLQKYRIKCLTHSLIDSIYNGGPGMALKLNGQ